LIAFKLAMLERCTPAAGAVVFGDIWGVDGGYTLECAERGCERVMLVDSLETPAWQEERLRHPQVDFRKGDFSDPLFMSSLQERFELGVAFDILLHQPAMLGTLTLLLDRVEGRFCVVQPMLEEQAEPGSLVYLPGNPDRELYPLEAPDPDVKVFDVDQVNHANWIWGVTPSFLTAAMRGEGFDLAHEEILGPLPNPRWQWWGAVYERHSQGRSKAHWSNHGTTAGLWLEPWAAPAEAPAPEAEAGEQAQADAPSPPGAAAAAADGLPLPPRAVAELAGSLEHLGRDPWQLYESAGATIRRELLAALPPDFELEGRRVLDFGCGAGRVLRHFLAEDGPAAEYWGCDVDRDCVGWLQENLSPPLHAFANGELPPLEQPDGSFDLVYCVSVFTHLSRSWSAWLAELHRVLKPGGLLVATFLGEGRSLDIAGEDWDEGRVGMMTLFPGQSWQLGGPMVFHSPWWIREHWGRLFDVVSLQPRGFAASEPGGDHGLAVLRRKEVRLAPAELEVPSADPREAPALSHNLDRLIGELQALRSGAAGPPLASEKHPDVEALEREVQRLGSLSGEVLGSRSWRLTAPLRRLGRSR
jgi:SAM-dependent methyltransferase